MEHKELLKNHHLKATPQRIAILKMMEYYGHISIEDLYRNIRTVFDNVSLATLYKNIHTMMSAELIKEVNISGLKPRYEIAKNTHAHIVCKECGILQDIGLDLNLISLKIVEEKGYKTEEISLVVSGTCPKCQSLSSTF